MKKKAFYETKEFLAIQKDWEKKLKASGFTDTESTSEKSSDHIVKQVVTVNKSFIVYNKLCLAYLHSGNLTDALDIFIFEKHTEGKSSNLIAELLTLNGFEALHRSNVDRRIHRILKRANIQPIRFRGI